MDGRLAGGGETAHGSARRALNLGHNVSSVSRLVVAFVTCTLLLAPGCSCESTGLPDAAGGGAGGSGGGGGAPIVTGRCDVDLAPFLRGRGAARVRQIGAAAELLAGPNAHGRVGDFKLENEVVRVVVQGAGRAFGPLPWGGTIIDADLAGEGPGNDQFGETGLLYNFGRTLKPDQFEVLADGADGGAAILAVSGDDAPNDYLSIRNSLAASLGRVPSADPYVPVPLRITTYFVLNPGEHRVRQVTAFCNTDNRATQSLAVGDLTDPGFVVELFNPQACTEGFGAGGLCFGVDRMSWYGYQGDGVAYGYAPWRPGSPLVPEGQNATLTVSGITGSILGANGLLGLGAWVQDAGTGLRDGELRVPPSGNAVFARDFWVAKELGAISTLVEQTRAEALGAALASFSGTVTSGGLPLPRARVALESASGRAVYLTDAAGRFEGQLPPRAYQVSAWAPGHRPSAKQTLTATLAGPTSVALALDAPRRLTVSVREAHGGPLPARVTVLCTNGPCPVPRRELVRYTEVGKDPLPDFVAHVGWVGATGTATFALPPDEYLVLVSRGPEYSVHPLTFPTAPGERVDLRQADATVDAVLARVVDTTGWLSADLHVHGVASPDSLVDEATRALTFAGDGLEVLVSTDHDVITDYAPAIAAAGLAPFLASVVGEEVSPMEWGHYNLFPLTRDPGNRINGGALDWARAEGPMLTVAELLAEGRRLGARTVQLNHPRGALGSFTTLQVDTDTLATHVDPASLQMPPQPDATAEDTKLLSADFDALELLNNGEDGLDPTVPGARGRFNDWFTLLSRGLTVAGTAVSDTHGALLATGWRTWVEVGIDDPAQLDPLQLSSRLNALRAVGSNGPFVTLRAFRVDGAGAQVTAPVGPGGTVPPLAGALGVEVEVQVPEYLDVTKVELYLHTPDDDGSCPIDPMSPRARTTRVACGGVTNANWPQSSIAASQAVALTPGDLETVATEGPLTFRRYRKRVTFTLPAPATDNWLVAMVSGSRSLAPLHYLPGGGATWPFAFTNPVFIDADGDGYDKPPFARARLGALPPQPPPEPPPAPSQAPEAVLRRWGERFHAH